MYSYVLCMIFVIQCVETQKMRELTDYLLDPEIYNKEIPPRIIRPSEDRLGIYINTFDINDVDRTLEISFYLRQSWRDERLEFNSDITKDWDVAEDIKRGLIQKIHVSTNDIKNNIFLPDLFFRNSPSKSLRPDEISQYNTLLTINSTGHVWFVRKLTETFDCPMNFKRFPFDSQMCPIMFESFKYTMDTLYFNWLDSPVDINPVCQIPTYSFTDIILNDCSVNYTAGAFPCLEVRFLVQRKRGHYYKNFFTPSVLLVIFSWSVFWTDISGFQVILELSLVLSMVVLSFSVNQSLPPVNYIKAIDVWFGACVMWICAALTTAVVLSKTHEKSDENRSHNKCGKGRRLTMARILFPTSFIVFLIIYFILYVPQWWYL